MKHEENVQVAASATLDRIKHEYADLLGSASFSLEKLFAPNHFRFDEFCKGFSPHPQAGKLKEIAEVFGEKYGIWLANAKDHVTCALFLYPTASFERLFTMTKNLILGFYLNDVMGRDTFKFLTSKQQKVSRQMINSMARLDESLSVLSDAHHLEKVNAEILKEFKENSPKEWFTHFLGIYCYHIGITHSDGNAEAQGHIPELYEYMELRCHLGGVHHILLWIEYSDGRFLDWSLLKELNIEQRLKRLHWVTAAFAGLSNDLFSFEKEVIDNGSNSNLLMIIALNNPQLSFNDVILRASEIVRVLLMEVLALIEAIKVEIENLGHSYPLVTLDLNAHLGGITRCIQAIWMWHCHSKRYKRSNSIWEETTLASEATSGRV